MAQEKLFENRIKSFLETEGIYKLGTPAKKMPIEPCGYYEKRHGNVFTGKGRPDLHIVVNGRSIDVEVKAENGVKDPTQEFMVKQINNCGGIAMFIYPKDFEMLKTIIIGIKNGR